MAKKFETYLLPVAQLSDASASRWQGENNQQKYNYDKSKHIARTLFRTVFLLKNNQRKSHWGVF
jgi:hypothetical protein